MSTFPFSSKTLSRLTTAIVDGYSMTNMPTLFFAAEVDPWAPTAWQNKEDRVTQLLVALRTTNSKESVDGLRELGRVVLAKGRPKIEGFQNQGAWQWYPTLRDAFAADGWEFDETNDKLVPVAPSTTMAVEVSALEQALKDRGFTAAAVHYAQAVDAFGDGKWESANGQLRSCFEDTVTLLGGVPAGSQPGRVQQAFTNLAAAGKLKVNEDKFGKAVWGQLHPNGSHPGLSTESEARFRLLMLTGYLRDLLDRV